MGGPGRSAFVACSGGTVKAGGPGRTAHPSTLRPFHSSTLPLFHSSTLPPFHPSQLQFPCLTDQLFAKAPVRFLFYKPEAGSPVKVTGGQEDVIRPKYDFTVTALPSEPYALSHQTFPNTQSSSSRFDEE